MAKTVVNTLDLNFQGRPLTVASYMVAHKDGVVLVESGPGSTIETLKAALKAYGYGLEHVTHVFLTHIHLDHAGASGALARHGAQIFVHPLGAPHMLNPEKLIGSATRIYGERMQTLWGDFFPVPEDKLTILEDNQEVVIGNLRFTALSTPGHAEHHNSILFEDLCFTGDLGAVRIPGYKYLRLPTPPPEFHLEKWRESILRLQKFGFKRIAPTHFGIFEDADWHLKFILGALDDIETWMKQELAADLPVDELRRRYFDWMEAQARALGLSNETITAYQLANPLGMSVDGMLRYWKKYRTPQA